MALRSFLLVLTPLSLVHAGNDRPIVGILTQPLGTETSKAAGNKTYIASSYVKWAESGGARVVPLHFDASDDELLALVGKINGIIFPGGGASFEPGSRFLEAGKLLYKATLEANKGTEKFPLHGTCLGFQLLAAITAEDHSVLCSGCFDSEGDPLPLDFTTSAEKSDLFKDMSASLYSAVEKENLTENSHHTGLTPDAFDKNSNLNSFYSMLSTNLDYKGKAFVSTFEAKGYPITGSQWHPEKNNFEWGKVGTLGYAAIPHSAHAVELSQYMANHFIGKARDSSRHFSSNDEASEALMENCPSVKDPSGYFAGVHIWDEERKCLSKADAWRSQDMLVV